METFLVGMVMAGFLLAGSCFASFWSRSRDLPFAAFFAAFALIAVAIIYKAKTPRPDQK